MNLVTRCFRALALLFCLTGTWSCADHHEAKWSCSSTVMTDAPRLSLQEARARALNGDAVGSVALSLRYLSGDGLPKDGATGLLWIRKASDQNCPPAEDALASLYETGTSGVDKDVNAAINLYRKAAEADFAPSQYALGLNYALGEGVTKDDVEAFKWYKLAADKHELPDAEFAVARAYTYGTGVATNYRLAFDYAMKSANQDYPLAEIIVAAFYSDKTKLHPKDKLEALKWMLLATTHDLDKKTRKMAVEFLNQRAAGLNSNDQKNIRDRIEVFLKLHGRHTYSIVSTSMSVH